MGKLLHAIVIGLIGAVIIHIVVLLLVPEFSERDAWSNLSMKADFYSMTRLDAEPGSPAPIKSIDPLFAAAACRFDLADGMIQVSAPGSVPFWSVSVYDRSGHNIYSFNDRSATNGQMDAVVLTPAQMIEMRKALPDGFEGSIFVEAPIEEGIVVLRAFVPDESWRPAVTKFLSQSSCDLQQF